MTKTRKLTAKTVEHAPAGKHSDGGGLTLVVKPSGHRSWVVRLTIDGKQRDIGVGGWPTVSLAEARRKLAELRADVAGGDDPAARGPRVPTFGEAAEAVHAMNAPRWRNDHHSREWLDSLRRHAAPLWGMQADRIRRADVIAVLQPLWHGKPETGRRVRQRIRKTLAYVMAHHEHIAANAAGEGIDAALPPMPKVKNHQRAISYGEVPAAIAAIEGSKASEASKLSLLFLILTGVRSGEARGARWDEIDGDLWTIPGHRMKGGHEHRVPLSRQALATLEAARGLDDESGLIFPSPLRPGEPLSWQALLKVLRVNGIDSTAHGFRTCLRQWLLECSTASWAVAEACLAHVLGNQVEHAYLRDIDLLGQRREVMQGWADFATG